MATILENQANISYLYDGVTSALAATSNTATTTLADACSVSVTKTPLNAEARNGDNVSYIVRVENTGSTALTGVTLSDNLGAGTLVYAPASLRVYVNSTPVAVTPTTTVGTLAFTLPGNLQPGDIIIAVYNARVNFTGDTSVNTVTVTGTGLNQAACQVSETATSTINAESYADLTIYKTSSAENINSGDTLSYTFTILNSGNIPATNVVLTDDLPSEFTINSVSATTNGVTTAYLPTEYTVDTLTNTITLPNATGTEITVPAAMAEGPGVTTVVITGTVA